MHPTALAPLRAVGDPVMDNVKVKDHMIMQTSSDAAFHHGIRSYAKNGMVKQWSQGLVDTLIDSYNPKLFLANHVAGGAVKRIGELDTAFPHRNAEIRLVFVSAWTDPAQDEAMIAETRALHRAVEAYMGGYYDNIHFDRNEATGNYAPAYERLAKIKGRFDPGNLFRLNSNLEPSVRSRVAEPPGTAVNRALDAQMVIDKRRPESHRSTDGFLARFGVQTTNSVRRPAPRLYPRHRYRRRRPAVRGAARVTLRRPAALGSRGTGFSISAPRGTDRWCFGRRFRDRDKPCLQCDSHL